MEYFDILNENGEFIGNAMRKDYGIEQYMDLFLMIKVTYYYKKEVKIRNYGQTYGMLL